VVNRNANTIRITVTGETNPPVANIIANPTELVLAITSPPEEELEIVVTEDRESDPYRIPNATTATRTDTPLRDIPQSIVVIPQQVIEDQQVIRLEEALNNVSSFIYGGTDTTSEARYILRGFDDIPVLQDGFRQYNYAEVPETANLEQIEVLKGPASILYGEIQPGGIINTVTKKPLSEPFYEAELQLGNNGFVRPRIDISGPISKDGSLLYRLNALYLNNDSFRDYDRDIERFFVAPVLSWKVSDRTDLTFALQYAYTERPFDTDGTVALGDGVADIPRDRILNEPNDFIEREFINVGYNLEHRFSDNWTLRNAFRYIRSGVFSDRLTISTAFDETTGILDRVYAYDDFESEDYSLQTNVVGKFATGSIKHTLLFGVDLNRNDTSNFAQANFFTSVPINVFDPVYEAFPRTPFEDLLIDRKSQTDRLGVYLQDQIAFDNFKLLIGMRYDTVEQKTEDEPGIFTATGNDVAQNSDAWTPRIGLVYQPIQELSLYASYSKSFNPSIDALSASGEPLEPERGEGYEIGIKAELFAGKFFATLAYFDITKQNVATPDSNFPELGFSVATGEQQSQGIELDLNGQILPGWNVIASYAYTDAQVTEDNVVETGNRLVGVPEHGFSLWTTYEIQRGTLQGLGFGMGFNYVGERQGDLDNSFELDSYFLTNAAIFYRQDNWRVALNFKNLFDVEYNPGAPFSRVAGIAVGEPFTVIGSISVRF
jgi:iron complex outermembrane recepter protein